MYQEENKSQSSYRAIVASLGVDEDYNQPRVDLLIALIESSPQDVDAYQDALTDLSLYW